MKLNDIIIKLEILTLLLLIVSCEDKNKNYDIFGIWDVYRAIYYECNSPMNESNIDEIFYGDGQSPDNLFYMNLMDDYTYIIVWDTPDDIITGNWEISGTSITFDFFGDLPYTTEERCDYIQDGDAIVLSYKWSDDNIIYGYEKWEFKRR